MREILFRGKCKDNGEWIEARGIIQSNDFTKTWFIIEDSPMAMLNIVATEILTVGQIILREVIPETVGRYTGLTDKNGKKIFEGDITDEGIIEYWEGKYVVMQSNGQCRDDLCWCYNKIEVLGNIHDNPELLGGDGNGNHI